MHRRALWLALLVALCARLPSFWLASEHYGDAPVRIEIAERWASAPFLWRGFHDAYQYGPLHLTTLGLALKALPDRYVAPKLVSLVAGLLSVWLLWQLAAAVRGEQAAALAAFALALSPLHIQASTTGASEAPFLALLLGCLLLKDRHVFLSACLLAAGGLFRYDGWLYVPLIALTLRPWRRALLFCGVNAIPAVLWLLRNRQTTGDALAPIHWIDRDHRMLADMGLRMYGAIGYRLFCVPYWPEAVLLIATPVVGLLAMAGAFRAIARKEHLALLAWIPSAYLTFRGAVLADFRPMVRFAMVAAALSLPYAWDAVTWLGERMRRPVLALVAISLVATPVALAVASLGKNGALAEWARPVSPISSVPPGIAEAARWLRTNATAKAVVLLDGVANYLDIPLAFEAGLRDDQWIRVSWEVDFEQRWARHRPTLAVLIDEGKLARQLGTAERVEFRGVPLCAAARFVYATIYRAC